MREYHLDEFISKHVLIVGEVGTGKTRITASLIKEALLLASPSQITLLDFAPDTLIINGKRVGGKVSEYLECNGCVSYSSSKIRPPRLEGKSRDEVIRIARENSRITTQMLKNYLARPTRFLFINDLTIHLHAGSEALILDAMQKSSTFVANAYSGSALSDDHGSGISKREKELLEVIKEKVDTVISLEAS